MAGMTTSGRAVLCAAAPYDRSVLSRWRALLRPDDVIVAVDGGAVLAQELGRSPALWVGDGDSLGGSVSVDPAVPRLTLPVCKDDTDTLAAARWVVSSGFTEALVLGGWGGRLDHAMANVGVLLYWQEQGVAAVLADDTGLARVVGPGTWPVAPDGYDGFSVLPVGGNATGVTIRNARYALDNATLTASFPVGVSNVFTQKSAEITLTEGHLLIYWCRF